MALPSVAPSYEPPRRAVAGETLVWLVRAADTPASDGWTCEVTLAGAAPDGQPVRVAATAEGTDFRVTVAARDTVSLGAGGVRWSALAARDGEVYRIGAGAFALEALDGLTQARRDLLAVDAALRALREGGMAEYTLGDRTVRKHDLAALRAERNALASRVRREQNGTAFVHQLLRF